MASRRDGVFSYSPQVVATSMPARSALARHPELPIEAQPAAMESIPCIAHAGRAWTVARTTGAAIAARFRKARRPAAARSSVEACHSPERLPF